MKTNTLIKQQLDNKMSKLVAFSKIPPPSTGWIRATRNALGMSLQQVGRRLSISRQSALDLERRELEGSLTLRSMRLAAEAMEMHLVYGFVPKDGSLDALINRKSLEKAAQIVMRASQSMLLEDQKNQEKRLKKAIYERAEIIKTEKPGLLWD